MIEGSVITDYGKQRMMLEMSIDAFEKARERGFDGVAMDNLADAIVAAEKLKDE